MRTIDLVRRNGAGTHLKNARGEVFRVSDWSPGTGDVYGHPINARGIAGDYQRLPPDGLKLDAHPLACNAGKTNSRTWRAVVPESGK